MSSLRDFLCQTKYCRKNLIVMLDCTIPYHFRQDTKQMSLDNNQMFLDNKRMSLDN